MGEQENNVRFPTEVTERFRGQESYLTQIAEDVRYISEKVFCGIELHYDDLAIVRFMPQTHGPIVQKLIIQFADKQRKTRFKERMGGSITDFPTISYVPATEPLMLFNNFSEGSIVGNRIEDMRLLEALVRVNAFLTQGLCDSLQQRVRELKGEV